MGKAMEKAMEENEVVDKQPPPTYTKCERL